MLLASAAMRSNIAWRRYGRGAQSPLLLACYPRGVGQFRPVCLRGQCCWPVRPCAATLPGDIAGWPSKCNVAVYVRPLVPRGGWEPEHSLANSQRSRANSQRATLRAGTATHTTFTQALTEPSWSITLPQPYLE
jgi:hypothetical protein